MPEPVKITADELKSVVDAQQKYRGLAFEYGKLSFAIRQFQRELDKLATEFDDLASQEQKIIQALNAKYGAGTLDIETGMFTLQE